LVRRLSKCSLHIYENYNISPATTNPGTDK
jgi:hypothetical protein